MILNSFTISFMIVFCIAIYYLKVDEWVLEAVLDIFLTLWNKRKELADIKNFEGYCFILIKNAALNYLSKTKVHNNDQLEDITTEMKLDVTTEHFFLNDELFVQALDNLLPKCREVFILIREQRLSYKEVAEQLLEYMYAMEVLHLFDFFSVFTPDAVKKVSLFKGSFPARFGGRLPSVIDVRTNDGDMHNYHGAIGIGLLSSKFQFEDPIVKDRTIIRHLITMSNLE